MIESMIGLKTSSEEGEQLNSIWSHIKLKNVYLWNQLKLVSTARLENATSRTSSHLNVAPAIQVFVLIIADRQTTSALQRMRMTSGYSFALFARCVWRAMQLRIQMRDGVGILTWASATRDWSWRRKEMKRLKIKSTDVRHQNAVATSTAIIGSNVKTAVLNSVPTTDFKKRITVLATFQEKQFLLEADFSIKMSSKLLSSLRYTNIRRSTDLETQLNKSSKPSPAMFVEEFFTMLCN